MPIRPAIAVSVVTWLAVVGVAVAVAGPGQAFMVIGAIATASVPVIGVAVAVLEPRIHERTRRQPRLSLLAGPDDDEYRTVLEPASPVPWPIDKDRVVANEEAEARDTMRLAGPSAWFASDLLAVRPSDEDHRRAREKFEAEIEIYSRELRSWLEDYQAASRDRHGTFTLPFRVFNERYGAHAEAVELVLQLPGTVVLDDEIASIAAPPDRPRYQSPRPRSLSELSSDAGLLRHHNPVVFSNLVDAVPSFPAHDMVWQVAPDGSLRATIGDVHSGQVAYAAEFLRLRATSPGDHVIKWTLLTKSALHPVAGQLVLRVPTGDAARPPFGRLDGILAYPDVEIPDADSPDPLSDEKVTLSPRTEDPPVEPPVVPETLDGIELIDRLMGQRGLYEWWTLGLDPAYDGPMSTWVRVERAEPAVDDRV